MNISVLGTGYVGLVTGTCLAEFGHSVLCMDRDDAKIRCLKAGCIPIYEEGLSALVARNVNAGRLSFTDKLEEALAQAEIVFLAIGTPPGASGEADLSMIHAAVDQIGQSMTSPLLIVQKSTCPVGTAAEIERRLARSLAERGVNIPFAVAVNPEFLREGTAVRDCLQPDRVVIGAEREEVGKKIASLYAPVVSEDRLFLMDRASAEMTKYAANALLAAKISFINEVATLCELVGADIEAVRRGIGSDTRIGSSFLSAGIGYGGSCFPKDVRALLKVGERSGFRLQILEAVDKVNRQQRARQVNKVIKHFDGDLSGKKIAVWGLAFKPGTDDLREAPSLDLIRGLHERGAHVVAYDPVAMPAAAKLVGHRAEFAESALDCADRANALVLVTEWPEFLTVDLSEVRRHVAQPVLFDFRNAVDPMTAEAAGFMYYGVGRTGTAGR